MEKLKAKEPDLKESGFFVFLFKKDLRGVHYGSNL